MRKAIVVATAVAAVMVFSSLLNHGKTDAALNNVLIISCTMVVLLMWGFYRFSRRLLLMWGWHPRILLALAFSVTLNGLGCMASLDHHRGVSFLAVILVTPIGFLIELFGHIFPDADFGNWVGLVFGSLFSIAFYAFVASKALKALGL